MDISILTNYNKELEEEENDDGADDYDDDDEPVNKFNPSKTRPSQVLGSDAPEFLNWVPGSSAGAGSEQFHIYRHLRRKEMFRLKQMEIEAKKEKLDEEWQQKKDAIKKDLEEKREKRAARRKARKARIEKAKGLSKLISERDKQGEASQQPMHPEDDSSNEDNEIHLTINQKK